MSSSITIRTLKDGGQQPAEIAHEVADFLSSAQRSLDLAQYDFHLGEETAGVVGGALKDAQARGVAVRILYNVDHANPIPVPPPPEPDVQLIASLGVPARAIAGVPDLMHHKYVVRDGETRLDRLDELDGRLVVGAGERHRDGRVAKRSRARSRSTSRSCGAAPTSSTAASSSRGRSTWTRCACGHGSRPAYADALTARIAKKIGHAEKVRILSPVITSAPVLGILAQRIADGRGDIAGCVDATQVAEVIRQWQADGNVSWKLPLLRQVLAGDFTGKPSVPWQPTGTLHNFMHAKVVVADDTVFAGSFNLSHSGEKNAENVLELADAELAGRLSAYVDEVRVLYPAAGSLGQAAPVRRRYSHSIVDGGFEVMSSTTRFTAGTSFTIRDEIVSSRS